MSAPIEARRHKKRLGAVVCGKRTCGGEIGKGFQDQGFSVPPAFVERSDEVGTYYEFPEKRVARERRGEEPLHHLSAPQELIYQNGNWRRVHDSRIKDVRMAIWRGVSLPARVRCPKCRWLNVVTADALTRMISGRERDELLQKLLPEE